MCNYEEKCKGLLGYNSVYNIFVYLLPLKSSVFVVHFSSASWHGKETRWHVPKHGS